MLGAARTVQIAGWRASGPANARREGTASTNASLTYTASDSAVTSTTQYKFGTASMRCTNSNSDIASASTTIAGFGTSDFTIEFWVWIDSLSNHSNSCDIFAHDTNGGMGIRLAQSFNTNGLGSANPKYLNVFVRNTADIDYFTLPTNWPTGQWNFVAIQRTSGSFAAWLNGAVLPKSNASSSYNFSTSSSTNKIGTADGGDGVGPTSGSDYVYIDEFCISNTYRYSDAAAAIPVPTAAFTVDSYTVQLLHMDGSDGGTTFTNATS
jgi:hypothetical protein